MVFEELAALDDALVIERLTQVKGIGVWTAHMFLIFALRRTDVLPTGDLGIRNAMRKAYGMAGIAHTRRNGGPGRALAALLLGGELVSLAQPGAERQFIADYAILIHIL